jgi:hypothetical protein
MVGEDTATMPANLPRFAKPSHLESRRVLRIGVLIESVLGSSRFGKHTVWMIDVSTLGCRIETDLSVAVGTRLVLSIPGLSPMGCEVRWVRNGALGLRFATPLHPLIADRIIARSAA